MLTPRERAWPNLEACIRALQEIGDAGWYSWEDEPEDRSPMTPATRNRRWIEERLKA